MRERKLSINAMVNLANLTYPSTWEYVRGYARPGIEIAFHLERLTNGFVDAANWLETFSEPEPAHKKKKTNKHTHAKEHKTHGSKDK